MDRIPGADTLGFGFDITKRFHQDSTTQRIFKEGKPEDSTVTLGKTTYAVPENIGTEPTRAGKTYTHVYTTKQEVQDYFSSKAGVSASAFGFKGHVDAAYSSITKRDRSYFYALVDYWSYNHNLKLKQQRKEWFTPDFAEDLASLPAAFNKETEEIFFAFFGTYGTHYVHQVQLGGSAYYYVAIEQSASVDQTKAQVNLEMEYEGVFISSSKVEAEAKWRSLGREWVNNRIVHLSTLGGEHSVDGISPNFNDWKGEAYSAWKRSVVDKPGVAGFSVTPISTLAGVAKKTVMDKALREYLRGGLVVKADRHHTPQTPRRIYTAFPTIDGPLGSVQPPSPAPMPERPNIEVAGVQLALFDPDTFNVLLNRVYYATPHDDYRPNTKLWNDVTNDIRGITARDYYCAFSAFGMSPIFYPPAEVATWLGSCGATLTEWQKYIGATGQAGGTMCYSFAGRKGMRTGAKEEFAFDPTRAFKVLNATSLYFLRGAGVQLKVQQS